MTTPQIPYRFELTLHVPGTPEQVWRAIATAEGITSWMMPTQLEPVEGGAVAFDMGPDATSRGRVTAFEPSHRFAYEEDWASLLGRAGADVTPMLTEFLVEARDGGTCVVRVVTSAFGTGADWENEFWEEVGSGWAPMLDNLRLYLSHFPDQQATPMWAGAMFAVTPEDAISMIRAGLGVEAVGQQVGARGVDGHVERLGDRHFLLRIDAPVPGFLSFYSFGNDEGSGVHLQGYLFSDGAPAYAEREQPAWQEWIDGVAATSAAPA